MEIKGFMSPYSISKRKKSELSTKLQEVLKLRAASAQANTKYYTEIICIRIWNITMDTGRINFLLTLCCHIVVLYLSDISPLYYNSTRLCTSSPEESKVVGIELNYRHKSKDGCRQGSCVGRGGKVQ